MRKIKKSPALYPCPYLYPCVMAIAGSDSSGGAGIQADIKTIAATGSYAATAITALTAQNTQGVQAIYAVPPDFVSQQIASIFSDMKVSAVKIGMLFNNEIIAAVAAALKTHAAVGNSNIIVLDPVMVSQSGDELLEPDAIESLKKNLFYLSTLITPNLSEAEKLTGEKITDQAAMAWAATNIGKQYRTNILIKGGHLNTKDEDEDKNKDAKDLKDFKNSKLSESSKVSKVSKVSESSLDVLYLYKHAKCHWYTAERIHTKNTHGTGCTLSSAIASYLAHGYLLPEAIAAAKQYLTKAIQAARTLKLGQGDGPLAHFYNLGNPVDDL